ncbi:MAG: hypothetical protein JRN23_05495 [Nitrososphaerota archaeon]|nr:hypothetical protein [Nitrososphaerota archaeon]MDG6979249.1 hypothetical protein [Nitrososphaerota archaeon]MDG7021364.1 hypothetical protein [Nitrososphaerota archaeon]
MRGVGWAALALLLVACCSQAAQASVVAGTGALTFTAPPKEVTIGEPGLLTTLHDNLGTSVFAIVIMVLRDNSGQMVYYSTATVNVTRGLYGDAFTVAVGLPVGAYNATVFAITPGGLPLSNSTTVLYSA